MQPPPVASSLAIRHWGGGWPPAVKKVEVGSEPFGTGVDTHTQTHTHTERPTHCLNTLDLTLHTEHLTHNSHSNFTRDEKCFFPHWPECMGCRGGGREVQSLHGERLDGDAEEMFTGGRHHLRVLPRNR